MNNHLSSLAPLRLPRLPATSATPRTGTMEVPLLPKAEPPLSQWPLPCKNKGGQRQRQHATIIRFINGLYTASILLRLITQLGAEPPHKIFNVES